MIKQTLCALALCLAMALPAFAATPVNIKDALTRLVKKARQLDVWSSVPRILFVAPIIIDERLYSSPNAAGMGEVLVGPRRVEAPQVVRVVRQRRVGLGVRAGDVASLGRIGLEHADVGHAHAEDVEVVAQPGLGGQPELVEAVDAVDLAVLVGEKTAGPEQLAVIVHPLDPVVFGEGVADPGRQRIVRRVADP